MLLGEAEAAHAVPSTDHGMQKMACHQMAERQSSGAGDHAWDTHGHDGGKVSHHTCTHCAACIIIIASAHTNTPPLLALKLNNQAIIGIEHFYFSRNLAPSTKPPIRLS